MRKIIFIFILISFVIIVEGIMRIRYESSPRKSESHQFKHNYIDIHAIL